MPRAFAGESRAEEDMAAAVAGERPKDREAEQSYVFDIKVLGADGYSVLRREPSGKWKTIKNVGDNNSFTDVPEKQNVAYEYTVRAYNYNALTDTYTYGSSNKKPLIRHLYA